MTEDQIIEIGARAIHDGTPDDRGPWEAREPGMQRVYRDAMRRALAAISEAELAIVPMEPTETMIVAGVLADESSNEDGLTYHQAAVRVYRAMLAAAQEPDP